MTPFEQYVRYETRRQFLRRGANALGTAPRLVTARLKHPARIVFIFIRVSPFRSAPRVRGSSDDELRRSVKRLSGAVAGANRGNRRIRARKNL